MAVEQSAAFKTAVEDSRKLTGKPSNEQLLELYALYKVGTGEDFSKSPNPGMFDLKASNYAHSTELPIYQGKAKKNAWQKHADAGLTPEKAQEQYVALVESLKESVGYDANKVPETVGSS
ncbi:unnamed protein product [Clonostachys byssicola]|uniref:ACB domain-containing protein n=1 Tax=Clonostachys byssicola TaxID=160290 RepID=A0A9N9Y9X1_9HYPO|nr:unnamed protein product [Clonostachys byssicola]